MLGAGEKPVLGIEGGFNAEQCHRGLVPTTFWLECGEDASAGSGEERASELFF